MVQYSRVRQRLDDVTHTNAVPLLWAYDLIVATLTRESKWRLALLRQLNPQPLNVIADIGCGTGSLLRLIGSAATNAKLIGIDPERTWLMRMLFRIVQRVDGYENTQPSCREHLARAHGRNRFRRGQGDACDSDPDGIDLTVPRNPRITRKFPGRERSRHAQHTAILVPIQSLGER